MASKVSDEIAYPFVNFNAANVKIYEWISIVIPLYNKCH